MMIVTDGGGCDDGSVKIAFVVQLFTCNSERKFSVDKSNFSRFQSNLSVDSHRYVGLLLITTGSSYLKFELHLRQELLLKVPIKFKRRFFLASCFLMIPCFLVPCVGDAWNKYRSKISATLTIN